MAKKCMAIVFCLVIIICSLAFGEDGFPECWKSIGVNASASGAEYKLGDIIEFGSYESPALQVLQDKSS